MKQSRYPLVFACATGLFKHCPQGGLCPRGGANANVLMPIRVVLEWSGGFRSMCCSAIAAVLFYSRSSTLHSVVWSLERRALECLSPQQLECGTVFVVVASLTLSVVLHTLHCRPSGHILDVPVAAAQQMRQFPFCNQPNLCCQGAACKLATGPRHSKNLEISTAGASCEGSTGTRLRRMKASYRPRL